MFEENKIAGTPLFTSWFPYVSVKKNIENYYSLVAGAHKVRTIVFYPALTLLSFSRFSEF